MIKITIKTPTLFKAKPLDSSILKKEEIIKQLTPGYLEVSTLHTWGNHLRVTVEDKIGYIFSGHIWSTTAPILPYFDKANKEDSIVNACEAMGINKINQKAYVLATIYHETAHTCLPIEEYYGRQQAVKLGYDGGANYFGRGFVQLTHKYNYAKYSKILGIDLVSKPELALQPDISLFIAIHGMANGVFTGKKLSDYINDKEVDYINARRIVNGVDKAETIKKLAESFEAKLSKPNTIKAPQSENNYIGINPELVKLFSQRTNNADRDKDGKNDAFQTCNISSVKMAIWALKRIDVPIGDLDKTVISQNGSRYSHNNLVNLLGKYGIKSKFSTTTTIAQIHDCFKKGNPIIYSGKFTMGGHIVLIAGYDRQKDSYLIFDPYGEPSKVGQKWQYQDIRKPYWLSSNSLKSLSSNTSELHWVHLLS